MCVFVYFLGISQKNLVFEVKEDFTKSNKTKRKSFNIGLID